jgi:fibro-slime domain-containing protein
MMNVRHTVRDSRAPRRGLAVILALVAVATAVLIGLSIASTRDATVTTGGGIVRAAQSRAAAAGSIDLAIRILDEPSAIAGSNGAAGPLVLFGETVVGGGRYSATVRDLATMQQPTPATLALEIQATGAFDNTAHTARAVGRLLKPEMVAQADLDLSEFALLATGFPDAGIEPAVHILGNSDLAVWSGSALARLGEPLFIGTANRNLEGVSVQGSSRLNGHVILEAGDFALESAEYDETLSEKRFAIPADIHVPLPPQPQVSRASLFVKLDDAWDLNALQFQLDGGVPPESEDAVPTGTRLTVDVRIVPHNGVLELNDGMGLFIRTHDESGAMPTGVWRVIEIDGGLRIDQAQLHVTVPTMLIVRGDLTLEQGQMTVEPGTPSLAIYVAGTITVQDGARIGPGTAPSTTLDPQTIGDASKVSIYSMLRPDGALNRVNIQSEAEVTARLYAPGSEVEISQSRFYGSIVGATIALTDAIFRYDPALNSGLGWTNPRSGVWLDERTPRPEIAMMDMLDDLGFAMFSMMAGIEARRPECGMVATIHVDAQGNDDTSFRETKKNNSSRDQLDVWLRKPSSDNGVPMGSRSPLQSHGPDDSLTLHTIVRDFRMRHEPRGHKSFGIDTDWLGPQDRLLGLMRENLAVDGSGRWIPAASESTPLLVRGDWLDSLKDPTGRFVTEYVGGHDPQSREDASGPGVPSREEVESWFADPPGSAREVLTLEVRRISDTEGNHYFIYDSRFDPFPLADDPTAPVDDGGFFPIDRKLFGNGRDIGFHGRNYGFTAEMHAHFEFNHGARQTLSIESSNEVWVYVRAADTDSPSWSQLVMDLGVKRDTGANDTQWQVVDFDQLRDALHLESGRQYVLSIYVAQRKKGDSMLRFASNFKFWTQEIPQSSDPRECDTVINMVSDVVKTKAAAGDFGIRRPDVPSDLGRYRIRMTGATP